MFSGLSKIADRNFVVGFLLPAVLGAAALVGLWGDPSGAISRIVSLLEASSYKDLTITILAILTGSLLLYLVNLSIYRFLEGYNFWPSSIKARQEEKYRKQYNQNRQWLRSHGGDEDYFDRLEERYEKYPVGGERLILPTKFGNAIRAFETYPLEVYHVSSIPVWLRLLAVIPKDYLTQLDNAKADVDFFVNTLVVISICFAVALAQFILSVSGAIYVVLYEYQYQSTGLIADIAVVLIRTKWSFLLACVVLLLVNAGAYKGAIRQVGVWGGFVKSAFDLYLPDLAKQLGYRLPETSKERNDFWEDVNTMFLYLVPLPDRWARLQDEDGPSSDRTLDGCGTVRTEKNGGADRVPEGEAEGNGCDEAEGDRAKAAE